jgi:hypothetical protein
VICIIILTSIILAAVVCMILDLIEDALANRKAHRLELKKYDAQTAQDLRQAAEALRDTVAMLTANKDGN